MHYLGTYGPIPCPVTKAALQVVLVVAVAAGCERPPTSGSTLTILTEASDRILSLSQDDNAQFLVFLPLVARKPNGELEGRLAKSWEHSPDYRRWTIHLRSDIRWHDGVPVTARDVEFTH